MLIKDSPDHQKDGHYTLI